MAELSRRTKDVLTLQRIGAYEVGERMIGPDEAVVLAGALGTRPAYLMAVDDYQHPYSRQEELLIRNWRALPERERVEVFNDLEVRALQHRAPASDRTVAKHYGTANRVRRKAKG